MNIRIPIFYILGLLLTLTISCNNPSATDENKDVANQETVKKAVNHVESVLEYFESKGDFINSKKVPTMVKTQDVFDNLGKFLIVDLRKKEDFAIGHIKGAKNVELNNLLDFMSKVTPSEFEKIVMVCYDGQVASYATSVLRLLDYTNIFAMKFGMSSWDKESAKDNWVAKISNDFADKLETKDNPKNEKGDYPVLESSKNKAIDVLEERVALVLKEGLKPYMLEAKDVFEAPEKYYIMNYWPKEKYDLGHIPTAVQYDPKKSLGRKTFLNTLPTDKPIVVYCYTGQHAAFVTAYLRILNYDAHVLAYGANSFMNGEMAKKEGWHAFEADKKVLNFKLEK